MHFLRFPNSLWFLQVGSGEEVQKTASLDAYITVSVSETSVAFSASTSTIPFSISAAYNISLSALDVTSVQVELSGFAYNITASAATASLLAYLSADSLDGGYERLNALVTVTPVYTLSQTGQTSLCVSAAYNITTSATTASIASYLSLSAAYNVSASASTTLLSSDQFSTSVACTITGSTFYALVKTQEAVTLSQTLVAPITASMTPILVIDRGGGLVWSRKKKLRIPVKVGYPLRDE